MKLLRSTKSQIRKDQNIKKNIPHMQITQGILLHSYMVNNDYQHYSSVLHTFVPNKSFSQLEEILPINFMLLKIYN